MDPVVSHFFLDVVQVIMTNSVSLPIGSRANSGPKKGKGSPFKKGKVQNRSNKLMKKNNPTLTIVGFGAELPYEVIAYTRAPDRDGFLLAIKNHVDGEQTVDALTELGIVAYLNRRVSLQVDQVEEGADGYPRNYIIRAIPDNNPSTEATRSQALQVMKDFFMDSTYSKYPPSSIATCDVTHPEKPLSMDNFLLSTDVLALMKDIIPEESLDGTFYHAYNDVACAFFSGTAPLEARMHFGFPTPPPIFVLPSSNNQNRNIAESQPDQAETNESQQELITEGAAASLETVNDGDDSD